MKNRRFILIIALALLALFPCGVLAAGPGITVQSVQANPGDTVSVAVTIADNPGLSYLKLRYTFDSEKLAFVRVEKGTVLTDSFTVAGNALSWDTGRDAKGNGTLVKLVFSVKEKASGTAAVNVAVVNCFNYDEQSVSFSVKNGAVTIKDGSAPAYIRGDVDGNGSVTSADARLALRASVKLEKYGKDSVQFLAADVDGNGAIEASDARTILRASVKLETLS